jgi:hypothetical protein
VEHDLLVEVPIAAHVCLKVFDEHGWLLAEVLDVV